MTRPSCVVSGLELPAEKRPRFHAAEGVQSTVRGLSQAVGLARMGVGLRTIEPGFAGTHRHFHTVEEEWVWVLSGSGVMRIGPHRIDVRAGSFVAFPPGPRPHHFVAGADQPLVLLEGGERRPEEERGWYVDLDRVWSRDGFSNAPGPPPREEGDPGQCVQLLDVPARDFQHEVDPRSRRVLRSLSRATGLRRQAVRWSRVRAGDLSTAYHTHDRTDEWLYILEGSARARLADERFEVGPGDFLGHPAGGPAHVMEPETDLVYLMGGQVDPDDVVIYPEAGVQRRNGVIEPL